MTKDAASPYSLRLTRLSDPPAPNDFVVLYRGMEVGRIYETHGTGTAARVWAWTIYMTSRTGREPTLDAAKARWRAAFEELLASGELVRAGVKLPE